MRPEVSAAIPFKIERVGEIQWHQLLSKHFLSGVVSLAIFVICSTMKKREDKESELL